MCGRVWWMKIWGAAGCSSLHSPFPGTSIFALLRFPAFPTGPARLPAPQVPGRSIPVAAGVDGGLGERLFRMLGAQIACRVRLSQVCVSQLFTCNCPSGVWANVRLGLRGRFLPAALPHCLCLPRCFAGQNSSPRRNSAQRRPIHSPLPAQGLSVWCQRPLIPEYYTKTMTYPKNPFGLAGSPFGPLPVPGWVSIYF